MYRQIFVSGSWNKHRDYVKFKGNVKHIEYRQTRYIFVKLFRIIG